MRRLRPAHRASELDISPLIDVVFILLIFFMVSTTFVKDAAVEIQRPSAASAARASTQAPRVYVDARGQFYVGEAPVKPWMLQSRVRELISAGGSSSVLVVADRRVRAELVSAVVQAQLALAADESVGEDELRAFFERNKDWFTPVAKMRVWSMWWSAPDEATHAAALAEARRIR